MTHSRVMCKWLPCQCQKVNWWQWLITKQTKSKSTLIFYIEMYQRKLTDTNWVREKICTSFSQTLSLPDVQHIAIYQFTRHSVFRIVWSSLEFGNSMKFMWFDWFQWQCQCQCQYTRTWHRTRVPTSMPGCILQFTM